MRAVPRPCEFYPGICLTTEEKARKNLSQGKKNLSQVKENLSQVKKSLSQVKKNLSHNEWKIPGLRDMKCPFLALLFLGYQLQYVCEIVQ